MTERELIELLDSTPREKSQDEVDQIEHRHDVERGPYIPHHHHPYFEESRH
jgi:hypothetical protein